MLNDMLGISYVEHCKYVFILEIWLCIELSLLCSCTCKISKSNRHQRHYFLLYKKSDGLQRQTFLLHN